MHCITFGRNAAGNLVPADVWIGCDGGVFRSTTSGNRGTFTPLNSGMASIQLTYLDQHPVHDSVVVAGCQDNGVLRHHGDSTWLEDPKGDGGGVAVDPNHPWRMMAQGNGNVFFRTTNAGVEWRRFTLPIQGAERVAFYTQICAQPRGRRTLPRVARDPRTGSRGHRHPPALGQLRLGHDVGHAADAMRRRPSATSSRTTSTAPASTRWRGPRPHRIYAATQRTSSASTSTRSQGRGDRPALGSPPGPLPLGPITDLAVANPATDDIYVSLGRRRRARLLARRPRRQRVATDQQPATFNAPAQAIAVDPANSNDVYVGTDVGVFFARPRPGGRATGAGTGRVAVGAPLARTARGRRHRPAHAGDEPACCGPPPTGAAHGSCSSAWPWAAIRTCSSA